MGAKKITEIELAGNLAGGEGLDANHASRARIQVLLDQHATLVAQTQFADAKTAGLVTLIGLLALKGPLPIDAMSMRDPAAFLAGAFALLCILFCLLSVFPRYPGRGTRATLHDTDRFSWPALVAADFDAQAYGDYMRTAEISQMVHSLAQSNTAVARILLRKYQMLRIAFVLGGLDLAVVFARHAGLA